MPRQGARITLYIVGFVAVSACVAGLFVRQIEELLISRVIFGEAPGRLAIPPLPNAMIAGEANQIPLLLHGHKARSATEKVSYWVPDLGVFQYDSLTNPTVLRRADGVTYVDFTPLRCGHVRIDVTVIFADGRNDTAATGVEVDLLNRKPISFRVHSPGESYDAAQDRIVLDLSTLREYRVLQFAARYAESSPPVRIEAEDVHFKVVSSPDKVAPVSVAGGLIWPKFPGHALILSSYAGLSDWTCVTVTQQASNAEGFTCSELAPIAMATIQGTHRVASASSATRKFRCKLGTNR